MSRSTNIQKKMHLIKEKNPHGLEFRLYKYASVTMRQDLSIT
jgi:hypothetical protein